MRVYKILLICVLFAPAVLQAATITFDFTTAGPSGSLTINTAAAPSDSDANPSISEFNNLTSPLADSEFVIGGGFANASSADLVQIDLSGGVNTVFVGDIEGLSQTSLALTFIAGTLSNDSVALSGLSGANFLFGFLITTDEFGFPGFPVDVTSVMIIHGANVPLPATALLLISGLGVLRSQALRPQLRN